MKITVARNNRTFEAYINSLGGGLAEISFYEVIRPRWKIFRTTILPWGTASFWVIDYPTIVTGINACLTNLLDKEAEEEKIAKMWKEFQKNS